MNKFRPNQIQKLKYKDRNSMQTNQPSKKKD